MFLALVVNEADSSFFLYSSFYWLIHPQAPKERPGNHFIKLNFSFLKHEDDVVTTIHPKIRPTIRNL